MTTRPKWKTFEELVGGIESIAGPRGAVVTRDDHLRDQITGELRQVDVSIRVRAGTTDILILIECRAHGRTQDVTWVEEMVTKLRNLGVSKIILVSLSGFSAAAKKKAEHYSIDLRELAEIPVDEIEDWFLPHGIVHLFRVVDQAKCSVLLVTNSSTPIEIDAMAPVLVHNLVHTPFPAVALLNFYDMRHPKRLWAVPLDGTKTRLTLDFRGADPDLIPVPLGVPKPEQTQLRLLRDGRQSDVSSLTLSFLVSYEATAFDRSEGRHHTYGAPGGPKIQHSEFDGIALGLPVTFEHQLGDGHLSANVRWPSGLKLPCTWAAFFENRTDNKAGEDPKPKKEDA